MQADHRTLTAGLVAGHEHLYATSAPFHAAIDTLTRMLPAWVDGLASQAAESDARLAAAIEAAERLPLRPIVFDPEGFNRG